jgi:TetR/AcrR family transcriptional repressor of bet genes
VTDTSARRVGRPSLARERRGQIVAAFLDLVAERGLERVTLDDVAKAAGVKRAALRHFVGNREELIVAAIDELILRYEAQVDWDEESTADELITAMFGSETTRDHPVEYEAWNSLLAEAVRRPATRGPIIKAYDRHFGMLAAALRCEYPNAPMARIRDAAYVIVCLVEQNNVFQQLGYPLARQLAARNAARRLAHAVVAGFTTTALR